MANYFITGSSTNIGKTHIITTLCQYLIKNNKRVMALKPIESGWNQESSDINKILQSLSLPITQKNIDLISYKQLKAALAPNMAAQLEGYKLDFNDILNFCINHLNKYDYLFIEGAGGVMSPLTDDSTYRDLAIALKIPVIFIAGTYLGTISHILTGLEALAKCEVKTIILNPYQHDHYVKINDLQQCIQQFTQIPVIHYDQFINDHDFL